MTITQSTSAGPGRSRRATDRPTPGSSPRWATCSRCPAPDQADSFVLHAPLELVARAAPAPLRPAGAPGAGPPADPAIADEFEDFGPPVPEPAATDFASTTDAAARLVAAIDRGELDDIDAVARWLGRAATAPELPACSAADVVPRLAAAAHAPIFLYHLPRVAPRGEVTGELLRGLARELGRAPEWRLALDRRAGATARRVGARRRVFDAIARDSSGHAGSTATRRSSTR